MRIIFFGSDEFSISALRACLDSKHEVPLVITTPAQKQGRGLKVQENPVFQFAKQRELNIIAPEDLKAAQIFSLVSEIKPHFFVVSSYGKYIPSNYLSVPSVAPLNVHPSLIPKYRGCGPIQWTILNGDLQTGVSIIEVAKKLDAGDVFDQIKIPVADNDDYPSLRAKLGHLSYDMILKILNSNPTPDSLPRMPQNEDDATYMGKLTKEDGHLSFSNKAMVIDQKVRALRPWPGTFMILDGQRVRIIDVKLHPHHDFEKPGTLLEITSDEAMIIAADSGTVCVNKVQPAGKAVMTAGAYANGKRIKAGHVFECS